MLRATRFIEKVGASSVFPNSGPPAFLDEDLFGYNDLSNSDDNPFPDQTVFIDYLAERGHDNARLLIPGSVAELKQRCPSTDDDENLGCKISHPLPDEDVRSIFTDKKRYLEAYAERERPRIDMERLSWPRYKGSLTEALAEWWNPLLALADHIGPGVGGPVLLEIGEEKVVIDFPAREVRKWVGEECNYRFAVASELVEALVAEHETDWVNSLFLSLRFRASRRGQYNEFIWAFFKCLAPDRLSYADGWYAEKEGVDELIRIGDFMVQRRCPHLKADLARFGEVDHGILQCAMHGWRFDLATGTCLTSCDHEIVSVPVDESQR